MTPTGGLRLPGRTGLAGIATLNVSNVALIRRTARIDRPAAATLVPYALWTGFASVLNADILRHNRRS